VSLLIRVGSFAGYAEDYLIYNAPPPIMIFIYDSKKYIGKTAVGIVRAVERDIAEYANKGGSIRDFLVWSLERMADLIPERELDVSPNLSDETIAFNYLCLLDNYEIGTFYDTRPEQQPSAVRKRTVKQN
jgi:hypothetical protein